MGTEGCPKEPPYFILRNMKIVWRLGKLGTTYSIGK